jgi:hypothetical protein
VLVALHEGAPDATGTEIRSWRQAQKVHGVGPMAAETLKRAARRARTSAGAVAPGAGPGPFPTIAEAVLAALLAWRRASGPDAKCGIDELRARALRLYRSPDAALQRDPALAFPPRYDPSNVRAAWWLCQNRLTSMGLLKRLTSRKRPAWRLTDHGAERAERVLARARALDEIRSSRGPDPRRAEIRNSTERADGPASVSPPPPSPNPDVLWQHHPRPGGARRAGVVVLVDGREGGGEAHRLASICRDLRNAGVRAEVRRALPRALHDYAFVWRPGPAASGPDALGPDASGPDASGQNASGPDRLLPLLVERKQRADVVSSVKDGRWDRQCAQLKRCASVLWPARRTAECCAYLLEGDERILERGAFASTRSCGCGCDGSGGCVRASWPSVGEVEARIALLQRDEALSVVVTRGGGASAQFLARTAERLEAEARARSSLDGWGLPMDRRLRETLRAVARQFTREAWEGSAAAAAAKARTADAVRRRAAEAEGPALAGCPRPPTEPPLATGPPSTAFPRQGSSPGGSPLPASWNALRALLAVPRVFDPGTPNRRVPDKHYIFRRRRSSNYAILIVLHAAELARRRARPDGPDPDGPDPDGPDPDGPDPDDALTKEEIMDRADRNWGRPERLCDKGMYEDHAVRPASRYAYDGWSGVSALVADDGNDDRYLLHRVRGKRRRDRKRAYRLSDEGRRIALLCHRDAHHHGVCGCGEAVQPADWVNLYSAEALRAQATELNEAARVCFPAEQARALRIKVAGPKRALLDRIGGALDAWRRAVDAERARVRARSLASEGDGGGGGGPLRSEGRRRRPEDARGSRGRAAPRGGRRRPETAARSAAAGGPAAGARAARSGAAGRGAGAARTLDLSLGSKLSDSSSDSGSDDDLLCGARAGLTSAPLPRLPRAAPQDACIDLTCEIDRTGDVDPAGGVDPAEEIDLTFED